MGATRWIGLTLMLVIVGCAPRVQVTKNPLDHDKGIRYYRPKPYLLVTPSGVTEIGSGSKPVSLVHPSDQFVSLELKYLPDFSEEYAIKVSTGLGRANVNLVLEDGWNLKSINQDLDSNFDDNVKAIAELTKSISGIVGTAGERSSLDGSTHIASNIAARNVPLGFYEAVIGRDVCGRKQLYGWRYVGFIPFATCPIQPSGSEAACCNDGTFDLYGLVFENGVMTFRPLHQVHLIPDSQSSHVAAHSVRSTATSGAPHDENTHHLAQIADDLQAYLRGILNDSRLTVYTKPSGESGRLLVVTAANPVIVNEQIARYLVANSFGGELGIDILPPPELPAPR